MAVKKRSKAKVSQRTPSPAPKAKPAGKSGKVSASKAPAKKAPAAPAKKAPAAPAKKAPAAPAKKAPAAPAKKAVVQASARRTVGKTPVAAPAVVKKSAAAKPAAAGKKAAKPAAAAAAATTPLGVGDRAPSFELLDQHGNSVSSSELDGHPYVLYFYPKNDTPGCTTEACGFRDAFPEFERLSARVLGVSPDSVASHQKFVDKYGLPFTLLSDPQQELSLAYGVWALKKNYGREYMGIVRSTFLVDAEGVVRKVWRSVRVNGHVPEVQAAASQLA